MLTIRGADQHADYAKKNNIFAGVGENVSFQIRKVPLYSKLIRFHNNIAVARNVDFVTHDVIHCVVNRLSEQSNMKDSVLHEHIGCIEIMDNVFIGSNTVILDGVRIGPNVIIATGSVVTKDVEAGSIVAGVPARKIGDFYEFVNKRISGERSNSISFTTHNQNLTDDEAYRAWGLFNLAHDDTDNLSE